MGHTYSNLLFHVIFSTKDRRPTIHEAFEARLYEYMSGVVRKELGRAIIIGGAADHLHALISLRTDIAVAAAMRKFKSLSSKWVHDTFPTEKSFAWQSGYAAFSVSQSSIGDVVEYIRRQADHHRKVTFEEEFLAFLDRHGIDYDAAHMWD